MLMGCFRRECMRLGGRSWSVGSGNPWRIRLLVGKGIGAIDLEGWV